MTVTLTQANTGAKVTFIIANIFYWYRSEAHKCTHIVSTGAAYCPVSETVDEINRLVNEANTAAKEGKADGTT